MCASKKRQRGEFERNVKGLRDMLDILEFLFRDFWTFWGAAILLAILSQWNIIDITIHKYDSKEKSSGNADEGR